MRRSRGPRGFRASASGRSSVQAREQRHVEALWDHAQTQMLRLARALRLAAKGDAEGDRRALAELIRALDRQDRYRATGVAARAAL